MYMKGVAYFFVPFFLGAFGASFGGFGLGVAITTILASYSSARVSPDRSKNHVFSSPVLLETTLSFCFEISVSLKIARLSGSRATSPVPAEGASPTLVVVASLSGVNLSPMK